MNQAFEPGMIVKGKVTGIKDYGIFVAFENGYKGMIHISEISEKYVKDINCYAKIGEIIPCKIIEIDSIAKHTKLTIKNLNYLLRRDGYHNDNFEKLKENLPKWIEEKKMEINNNFKK